MKSITCILLLISTLYFAQNYISTHFTTENGLPQNSVKDITQDRYGYIWISTENGILRYDGRRFLQWHTMPLNNLHFRTFYGSREQDSIMIRNQYDHDRLVISGRSAHKISDGSAETDDGIYINGQFYDHYRRSTFTEPIVKSRYTMTSSQGRFLFSREGIRFIAKGTGRERLLRSSFDMIQMANTFLAGSNVFITDHNTGRVTSLSEDNAAGHYYPLMKGKDASVYFEQLNGQAFLLRGDTVYLIEENGGKLTFRKLFHHPGLRAHRIYCMYYDEDSRVLYLGSLNYGLLQLRPHLYACARNDKTDESTNFNTLLPFPGGKIVDQYGQIFSPNGMEKNMGFDRKNTKDGMSYDSRGNILCYRNNTLEWYGPPPEYRKLETRTLDADGIIYIFNTGGTWFVYSIKNQVQTLSQYSDDRFKRLVRSYRMSGLSCIRRYSKESVLIGCMTGLYLLDHKKGRMMLLSGKISVKNIARTRDGKFWLLTYAKGIYLWSGHRLVRMPSDDAGNLNSPHDLLEDDRGYLWISTNNGLYRVYGQTLISYAEDPSVLVHYYRYSTRDGLKTNEFNGIGRPGATRLDNGSIAFPSMDGVVFFNPDKTPVLCPLPASLTISRLTVGGATTSFRDNFSLQNDFYRAEVHVDAAYYGNSENLFMEARLDGGAWKRLGEDCIYTIERIDPGDHILQVRMLTDGFGRYDTRWVTFRVEPLFYQTILFKILLACVILGVVSLLIRMWTRSLRENLRTQKAISTAIEERLSRESGYHEDLLHAVTHDVATPIKHLSNLSRLMLNTTDPELRSKYFESIYRSTEDLYNHTLELREYRSAFYEDTMTDQPYAFSNLVESKLLLFSEMARYGGVAISNHVPENLHIYVNRSIMSIIVQNLIDNALKNTRDGAVEVSAQINENYLSLIVSDTGSGMSPELRSYYNGLAAETGNEGVAFTRSGIGLHLSIRLARKLKAQLLFTNNSPQGTTIILKLDLNYVQKDTDSR